MTRQQKQEIERTAVAARDFLMTLKIDNVMKLKKVQ